MDLFNPRISPPDAATQVPRPPTKAGWSTLTYSPEFQTPRCCDTGAPVPPKPGKGKLVSREGGSKPRVATREPKRQEREPLRSDDWTTTMESELQDLTGQFDVMKRDSLRPPLAERCSYSPQ